MLPKTIYHNGRYGLELCGLFTRDPGCKKHITSLKGYDYNNKEEVGHACRDLVLQGEATKTNVIHLKIKMIADWQLAKGCWLGNQNYVLGGIVFVSGVCIAGSSHAMAIARHHDLGIKMSKVQHMHAGTCTCNVFSCSSYTHSHMHMHISDKHVCLHALNVGVHRGDVLQHV